VSARRFSSALIVLAALALATFARPIAQTRTTPSLVAIRGGTLLTVTKGTIPNGTIVLRDGKIAAVGAGVPIPSGADVVDAAGKFISPGIIDCHSHIAADSINEGGTTVSSMTGIEDVFNPSDVDIYRDLAGGVTTANVLHGSANPIGGKNYVIKLRWGKTRAEDFKFEGAMPGIKFALGENPKRPGGGAGGRQGTGPARYPATRMGVEYVIRDAFNRAKAYQQEWQDYDRRKKAGENVVAPRRDLQLEPLVEILEGKRLVHAHSYRADEILMLLRVADEFNFKIATLQHVLEGYKVAREIAAHGAGASTFADWWGYKIEAIDAIPYNAALMTRKGVLVSVNSDSAELSRHLNTEAAKSIKWGGLTDDEAFNLVTINPAKQLRIDNRVGSLEVGKDADVVIWNHHPLSSYAITERVYIDGQKYYDRQDDQKRLTELAKEKESLANADRNERRAPTSTTTETPRPGENRATSSSQSAAGGPNADDNASSANVPRATSGVAAQPQNAAARPRPVTKGVVAITNAKIFPIAKPAIDRGTIVMRDGIIEAVGANVSVPSGAHVIDAAGAEVYPGFIDASTPTGLVDPGAGGFGDADELLDFNPALRAQVAFHNDSEAIPVLRANGITTVAATPGGGLLGGQIAVMDLDGFTWEESTVAGSVGMAFQFPRIGGGSGRGGGRGRGGNQDRNYDDLKKERDAELDRVARLLDDARAYAKATSSTGAERVRGAGAPGVNRDLALEALVPVVEKRAPLVTRVNNEHDIRDAIAFADRVSARLVIVAPASEAALAAPLLKEKNVPVIVLDVLSLPSREDLPHQASYSAAGELVKAGVKIAFAVPSETNARQLPYNAAESVAWGLPREEALKALTINSAEILGVADRVGSIEPGKIANLIVAKGDPLEVRTQLTHVIIAGRDVPLDNSQLALYERYSKRP
jgi:imidazolonepropionase-like amidohydrolase